MSLVQTLKQPSKWSTAWDGYWFAPASAVRLAVMRIVVVTLQLTWFSHSLAYHNKLIAGNDGFREPQILIRLLASVVGESTLRDPALFKLLFGVWIATGVLSVLGLLTRPALLAFGLINLFFISHGYSYGEEHHPEALYAVFIILLALGPSHAALSLDALIAQKRMYSRGNVDPKRWGLGAIRADARWPILLAQWLLVIAYFYAGLVKPVRGGIDWFNGTTLQTYLLMDAIRWDRPVGLWMAQQKALCILASYGAVFLELFVFVGMIYKRVMPLFLLGLMSMHLSIFIMQAAPFWHFLVLYLMWVPWERVPGLRAEASPAKLA